MKNIFPKIDKKVLVIVGVILIVVLIASFFIYQYSKDLEKTVQLEKEEIKIETPGVEITAPNENQQNQDQQKGFLTVCADKCGDGICQPAGTCNDKLDCVCVENTTECPQDCK